MTPAAPNEISREKKMSKTLYCSYKLHLSKLSLYSHLIIGYFKIFASISIMYLKFTCILSNSSRGNSGKMLKNKVSGNPYSFSGSIKDSIRINEQKCGQEHPLKGVCVVLHMPGWMEAMEALFLMIL